MFEIPLVLLCAYGVLSAPGVPHDLGPTDNRAERQPVVYPLPGTENLLEKELPISKLFAAPPAPPAGHRLPGSENHAERAQVRPELPGSQNHGERAQVRPELPGIRNLDEKRIPEQVLRRLAQENGPRP